MTRQPVRGIHCRIQYNDLSATVSADIPSWSPDVASDLVRRTVDAFRAALAEVVAYEDADDED